ncbi:MAG: HTTM domain-containing protein [Verrucomicrobiota bacterium]
MPNLIRDSWKQFCKLLFQEVEGSSLALFRISFGAIMFAHAIKYLRPQGGTSLKKVLYNEETFNFTYPGFGWAQPLPEPLWTALFWVMGIAALLVALGIFYRSAAATLFLTYTYIFLSEVGKFNNHYYLMCLLGFLLIFMPADRRFSLSAWLCSRSKASPAPPETVPFWTIFLLRSQLFIVYFFGGIAKLNADWLTGIPMVGKGSDIIEFWTPLLGLPEIEPILAARAICWIGLIYDLSIGFLLLCRRTRVLGILLTLIFHLSNHFLFSIGIFPFMAMATTLIFFEPDWPTRLMNWIRQPRFAKPNSLWAWLGALIVPIIGFSLGWADKKSGFLETRYSPSSKTLLFVCCFLLFQLTFPLRHYFIPGDANWTEEGQDFSWRMMLRAKDASHVIYHLEDPSLIRSSDGRTEMNWSLWPEDRPKTIFVPVESTRFQWSHHPGLTATFEPGNGLRYIYRLGPDEEVAEKRNQLIEQWKETLGRTVSVEESIEWTQALDLLTRQVGKEVASTPILSSLDRIKQYSKDIETVHPFTREKNLSAIASELEFIQRSDGRPSIRKIIQRLDPFLVQGAAFPQERFLIVIDPMLDLDSKDPEKLAGGREFLVWIDLGRLRPAEWRELPNWFCTFENRRLRIIWNYSNHLNHIQMTRFTTSPWMIRQYAREIASIWEDETGRTPEVKVTSNLMMNYRVPQPLIDPDIDLSSAPYSTLRHNDWILPLNADVGSATRHGKQD